MTSLAGGWKSDFTPEHVRIESLHGDIVEERHAPRTEVP
jgi:hypothetical protein